MDHAEEPQFKFIAGPAGTGKSWIAREMARDDPSTVLTATTGIAAVNLGGDATTINSLLQYFDTRELKAKYQDCKLDQRLRWLTRRGLRHIIIDEASMLSADQLDLIVRAVDRLFDKTGKAISITLFGDFAQLPTVDGALAFEAKEWHRFADNTEMLTKIYRQDEPDFLEALHLIRMGKAKQAVEFFEPFMYPTIDREFHGTTIFATNAQANRFNNLRSSEIHGELIRFSSGWEGPQLPEWNQHIPNHVDLKVGSIVMILSNEKDKTTPKATVHKDFYKEFKYINGDLGVFEGRDGCTAKVTLYRTGNPVWVTHATVESKHWGNKASWKSYMPLKEAFAVTSFKSQGCTLDSAQIDFRHQHYKTPGMLYVALSRVRSSDGLRLVGNPVVFVKNCKMDRRVTPWL